MPLHDHFRPPLDAFWPWSGCLAAWATTIATGLNRVLLPPEFYAVPLVRIGGEGTECEGGTAWPSRPPTLTIPIEPASVDSYQIQVFRDFGGPQSRAAIELVSPANKDRPASRHAFAAKCAGYLRRGVGVLVVDAVTSRSADMHAEVLRALEPTDGPPREAPGNLFAASYRVLATEPPRVVAWAEALAVGSPLPTLPLWIEPDLSVPLALEESYATTCESLRMRG